jgi:UDP:flavonoid glycosyltransferase YjiC (YdhE family)
MGSSSTEPGTIGRKRRILFFAEAVTLCHVSRPLVLAKGLDPDRYDLFFACAPQHHRLLDGLRCEALPLRSVSGGQFLAALADGKPVYDTETLRSYVREDLNLLGSVAPDLVVGDFRLSLAASAPLARVPYMTVTSAYWSPYVRQRFPVPELPLTRAVGARLAGPLFRLARPLAFAYHARPLNRVRRENGLSSLGHDLRRTYTWADHTLYADAPELVPTKDLPANHHYLGPILWSFPVHLPAWWATLPDDKPRIHVSLGSSGRGQLLPSVLEALRGLPVVATVATSGREEVRDPPPNAHVADYLPGIEASREADLVVCHGGSAPAYVALAVGTPVLGIPSNLDQHLTIQHIRDAGAGALIRSEEASPTRIRSTLAEMLANPAYAEGARRLAAAFGQHDAVGKFRRLVDEVLDESGRPTRAPCSG